MQAPGQCRCRCSSSNPKPNCPALHNFPEDGSDKQYIISRQQPKVLDVFDHLYSRPMFLLFSAQPREARITEKFIVIQARFCRVQAKAYATHTMIIERVKNRLP